MPPQRGSSAFGNHTTAVQILTSDDQIPTFVDLGTGAVDAMNTAYQHGLRDFRVIMTHFHMDHTGGCFYVAPFYHPDCRVTFYSTTEKAEDYMRELFRNPYHPIDYSELSAEMRFRQIPAEGAFRMPHVDYSVSTCRVCHPQGCVALRFDDGENALVFATDVELAEHTPDDPLHTLLREPYPAAFTVVDGFFLETELPAHRGWGHSCWQEAVALTQACNVPETVITHHHPRQSDAALEALEAEARGPVWARQGDVWTVTGNQATLKRP
jgi:phosphoribosyl 1,2-cyclic phosphodiesterase